MAHETIWNRVIAMRDYMVASYKTLECQIVGPSPNTDCMDMVDDFYLEFKQIKIHYM